MENKVVLVTGASSGMGKETCMLLAKHGYMVYGVARRKELLSELEGYGVKTMFLDLTDDKSMQDCVKYILDKEGKIDILINNAGYGSFGTVEDVPLEEARKQVEVNLFGLARMAQLVTPSMRKNNYGIIVNIASVGGRIWSPFGGWYHATKHAVEGLSHCMRMELEPFGIDVIIVEPGVIKTNWGAIAKNNLINTSGNGAYSITARKAAAEIEKLYLNKLASSPVKVAECIKKAISVKRPKPRYSTGFGSKACIFLLKLVPIRIFDKFMLSL